MYNNNYHAMVAQIDPCRQAQTGQLQGTAGLFGLSKVLYRRRKIWL
jgi:hypothetical protein